jgi:aerobic-type carbon monoxide dehydrogenase small subunit (CoxS/CutS family)
MRRVIYWKAQPLTFEPGETIAATLTRHELSVRASAEDTGWRIFCGIGLCQQCVVLIDGNQPVEACLTLARDEMKIEPAQSRKEDVRHD